MRKPLVFKNYDQAIMFKVLNDLPKDVVASAESFKRTVLLKQGKLLKLDISDKAGKEWVI
jgi:hypothetical protein